MNHYAEKKTAIPKPDYDLMWTAVEKEVYKRQLNMQSSQRASKYSKKAVPISIAFGCFLLAAVPVFASVTLNWDKIGGRSVTNALNNGIGQQYDLKASSAGVTMSLNGVVTDGEKMKMLISLDTDNDLTEYIGFATEQNTITSPFGGKEKGAGYLEYDPGSKKLLGIYETADTLKDDTKNYKFEAQNLIFYRNRSIPLQASYQAGDIMNTGVMQYPTIQIESVREAANQTIVRYRVGAAPSDMGRGNPHLVVQTGGQEIEAIPTIMPSEGSDLFIEQVFNMSESDWKKASLQFTYIEEAKQISGTWKFDFQADGKKASEAIYTKKLASSAEFQAKTGVTLDQLVITPLDIQLLINEEESLKKGIVHYATTQLVIGDKTITGGWNSKGANSEGYQHLFQFESPEWYKNWVDVPMKLILKDAVVEKRDTTTNWVTLNQPNKEKQSTTIAVEGLDIQFTYYTEGEKLIIESSSQSPGFKSVNQTTLRINGKEVIPEVAPKGMVRTGTNIDTYKDVPFEDKIELNPGIYKFSDPSRDVEINL